MRSIDLLTSYLKKKGCVVKRISLGHPKPLDFFHISDPNSGQGLIFSSKRISYPPATTSARDIASDKTKSYDLAKSLAINYPETILVEASNYNLREIRLFLKKHRSVIVKPRNGLQSGGLSVDIGHLNKLKDSIQFASSFSENVLIQKQAEGEEVRFIIINRTVRAALLRKKPCVVGDGKSTIAQLLAAENKSRAKINFSLVPYPPLDARLISNKLPPAEYIPQPGEVIELSRATMIRGGASVYEILSQIDPSYVAIAQKLANNLIAPLICVDIMIEDYVRKASGSNYNFIEMNLGMSLPMCYSCRDGKHFPIIEKYLGPMLLNDLGNL